MGAGDDAPDLPFHLSPFTLTDKYSQVVWVLYRVLALNFAVAVVKIGLGYATGAAHERSECYERPERRERV